jgi:stage II sporulation protein P
MIPRHKRPRLILWLVLAGVLGLVSSLTALAEAERTSGYYTVVDRDTGQVILRTGLVVRVGDQYLTGNNLFYRITRIQGETAYADFVERVNLQTMLPPSESWPVRAWKAAAAFLHLAAKPQRVGAIAIYHTHSDESYVPTDGTDSIPGRGGIYQVGKALADKLKGTGQKVVHSYAVHNPHDGMAYERSRRTAIDLLRENPAALLDIHRDAAPRQEYADRIGNEGVTKIQIVLGRSNPKLAANEDFAKRVKAVIDRKYPGLIKGIFYGSGRYNQDLTPRALLLEMGAQTNARQSAERGAAIFAAAAQSVITSPTAGAGPAGGSGTWRALLYILEGILALAVLFLLINAGSFRSAGRHLGSFVNQEFTSALGQKKRKPSADAKKRADGEEPRE